MGNNKQSNEFLIYQTEDGLTQVQLKAHDGTVWLTQAEIADLLQTSSQNITLHVKSIYEDGELTPAATCKNYLQVRQEGERQVQRSLMHYNLDMILAIGYRVRSSRGIQFRHWASITLKEYLVKGFVLNDERLKHPDGWDYFDLLLERIRDIRTTEKRFYQKIRDLYATSIDYDAKTTEAQVFFKTVQNKMLWATTGKTAAELIVERANANLPNMGLTSWKRTKIRKTDVLIAKNYLNHKELIELNGIVTMFLDFAEDQAKRRQAMTMKQWEKRLDAFLIFNDRAVLTHAGNISHEKAEQLVSQRFDKFDDQQRNAERLIAEEEYMQELKVLLDFEK